jgi:hypothetical protein
MFDMPRTELLFLCLETTEFPDYIGLGSVAGGGGGRKKGIF